MANSDHGKDLAGPNQNEKNISMELKVGLNSNQALNLNSYIIYTFVLREE